MAKAKKYMGESYTDSLGQQWRWDGKTYVRNYGTSPMASIKRSVDQKIIPLVEQAGQALSNKGPIEGRGRKRNPKDEATYWFNAVLEDPSLDDQTRTSLLQANFSMQNAFELIDTDTMTYAQSIALSDNQQDLSENITKVEKDNKQEKVEYTEEPGNVETFAEAQAARNEDKQFRNSSSVEDSKKTTFLEDTANSPAAKAGLDDNLRWEARQRYEDFLKKREVKSSLGNAK